MGAIPAKGLLIGGKWVDAASGRRFPTLNPSNGQVLAEISDAAEEDVNRAVAAARRAFEGPWSKFKPFDRQRLLLKIAEIIEKNYDELSMLDTIDMGAPVT